MLPGVESEFTLVLALPVAGKTVFRKDGPDVFIEAQGGGGGFNRVSPKHGRDNYECKQ
jgi:hypothetical protein